MPGLLSQDDVQPNASPAPSAGLIAPSDVPPKPITFSGGSPFGGSVANPEQMETSQGRAVQAHQLGVLGTGLAKGAASVLTLPDDARQAAMAFMRRVMGDSSAKAPAPLADRLADQAGLPQPQNSNEKVLDVGGSLVGGLATPGIELEKGPIQASDYWRKSGTAGAQNQKILGTLLANEIGVPAETLVKPELLRAAGTQIRSFLDAVRGDSPMLLDPADIHGAVSEQASRWTPTDGRLFDHPAVKSLLDTAASSQATAADLGRVSSNLGSAASKIIGDDYQQAKGLFGLQDKVESLLKEGFTPQVQQAYDAARKRYGLFTFLRDTPGVMNADTGKIATEKVADYYKATDPEGYSEGANNTPLYQILRQSEGMGSAAVDYAKGYYGRLATMMRAAGRTVPGGAQYVQQNGIRASARALANKPGFLTALGQELSGGDNGVPASPDNGP